MRSGRRDGTWVVVLFTLVFVLASVNLSPQYRAFVPYAPWLQAAVLLVVALILPVAPVEAPSPESGRSKRPRASRDWSGMLCALLIVAVVAYWHVRHARDLRSLPIDTRHADMLPLLLKGFDDLDRLRSPYRPHAVPWILHNYYLPATFVPYYLLHKLHVDPRWLTVLACDAINLLLGGFVFRQARRSRRLTLLCVYTAVVSMVNFSIDSSHLIRITVLGPFWLYTCLAFLFLAFERPAASAVAFCLAIASREDAVVYALVPAAAALWHCASTGRRLVAGVVAGLGVIFAPFFIADPFFYAGNIKQYESLGWVIADDGGHRFIGFSGILHGLGLLSYRWALFAGSLLAVVGAFVTRSSRFSRREVARYAASTSLLFALFSLVAWDYLFVACLIILAVYTMDEASVREAGTEAAGTRRHGVPDGPKTRWRASAGLVAVVIAIVVLLIDASSVRHEESPAPAGAASDVRCQDEATEYARVEMKKIETEFGDAPGEFVRRGQAVMQRATDVFARCASAG